MSLHSGHHENDPSLPTGCFPLPPQLSTCKFCQFPSFEDHLLDKWKSGVLTATKTSFFFSLELVLEGHWVLSRVLCVDHSWSMWFCVYFLSFSIKAASDPRVSELWLSCWLCSSISSRLYLQLGAPDSCLANTPLTRSCSDVSHTYDQEVPHGLFNTLLHTWSPASWTECHICVHLQAHEESQESLTSLSRRDTMGSFLPDSSSYELLAVIGT